MGPIKDFEISFDPKLKFNCHINNIIKKSNKMLDFINRNCADFTDKYALKSLYCSLMRFICKYGFHINLVINLNWKKYNKNSYVSFHLNILYPGYNTLCMLHFCLFLTSKLNSAM